MSTTIMNYTSYELDRRQVIKRKVLAIGKISRSYNVLKDHPELVSQLKTLSANGKLPVGTLSMGEQGIKEAIMNCKTNNIDYSKLKEQKDVSLSHIVAACPNYKLSSREGAL